MKTLRKVFLSTVTLLSTAFWTSSAQAIPAFARQVDMACTACH